MVNVQSWLTHKARRAIVVGSVIPDMELCEDMLYCPMQALPEPLELREVEQMCGSLLQQERELISVRQASCS